MQLSRIDPVYADLGKRIRALRKQADVSQDELAQRIGLTRTSISNIERGRQQIQVHTLLALARVLNARLDDLLTQNGEPTEDHGLLSLEEQAWVNRMVAPTTG